MLKYGEIKERLEKELPGINLPESCNIDETENFGRCFIFNGSLNNHKFICCANIHGENMDQLINSLKSF